MLCTGYLDGTPDKPTAPGSRQISDQSMPGAYRATSRGCGLSSEEELLSYIHLLIGGRTLNVGLALEIYVEQGGELIAMVSVSILNYLSQHGMATTQPESTSGSNVLRMTTAIETRPQAILTRSNNQISNTLHTGSVAMRIPDEILDMIVRQAHKIHRGDQTGLSRSPCIMVSLVCSRWRNIALPYLFRSIKIPFRGQGLQCCSQFFSDNSVLASLVHNVDISDIVLKIIHLDHLLASLHGLQELHVSSCTLNGPSSLAEGVVNECVVGNHSIRTLEIHFNNNESSVPWYHGVLEIMALFSEIKEFTLCSNHRNDVQDLEVPDIVVQAAASAVIGGLNISALTLLECPPFMISFLWRFLSNIGGLHDLQSLGISLGIDPEKMLSHMSDILCLVGRKLKCLTVDVPYYVDFWAISSHDSGTSLNFDFVARGCCSLPMPQ